MLVNVFIYMSKFKGIILPYYLINETPHIMLGKAHIGNYGYLGGTQEDSETELETAAREFWEESKCILPEEEILKAIKYHAIVLKKIYKKVHYYFFILPWNLLTNLTPFEFISEWRKRNLIGDKFNEKKDIRLVHINATQHMTRTVRMILPKVRFTIYSNFKEKEFPLINVY